MIAWFKRFFGLLVCAASLHAAPLVEHTIRIHDTGSMRPLLREGDVIRVLPIPMERVREGHVIHVDPVSRPAYAHVVLRVSRAANGELCFITKGISNSERDPIRVSEADYRGVLDVTPIKHRRKP